MTQVDVDVVTDLIRATGERDWDRVLELVGERAVSQDSSGRIYVGHRGVQDWRRDVDASTTARSFDCTEVRDLGDGYVIVIGAEHRTPRHGIAEAVPGAWIYLVDDGRIHTCMYFRTEREAIASLSGPGRSEPATEVMERVFQAFNRDDYSAIVANLSDDIRFVSSLVNAGEEQRGIGEFLRYMSAMRARFDDVLVEELDVEELEGGWAVTSATRRIVDDANAARQEVVFIVRVADGRMTEWRPVADVEAGRAEVARLLAAVEHEPR